MPNIYRARKDIIYTHVITEIPVTILSHTEKLWHLCINQSTVKVWTSRGLNCNVSTIWFLFYFLITAVYTATGCRHTRAVVISRLTSRKSCYPCKLALQKGDASLHEERFWFIFDLILHSSVGKQNDLSTSLSILGLYGDLSITVNFWLLTVCFIC